MSREFAFKQFTVHDDRCQMKVGTDSVLIGAWADVTDARNILDIGTGSGLIALMLAQRNAAAFIDGVEILENDANQARENAVSSPWADRISIHNKAIQAFETPRRYDLIVSNPPYFVKSQLPPAQTRASVRHTISLSHDELIARSIKLLQPHGLFSVILPPASHEQFVAHATGRGLHVHRQFSVHTRPGRPVERYLMEFTLDRRPSRSESLCLYSGVFEGQDKESWSPEYRSLVKDFYL